MAAQKVRVYEFERGTTLEAAVSAIRASLEDEGLTLAPEYSHGKITSVIFEGRFLVRVPETRIVSPVEDEKIRDIVREAREDLQAQLAGGSR